MIPITMIRTLTVGFAGLALTVSLVAQSEDPREFEVASVKQNKLNDRIVNVRVGPGGKFTARGYTLVLLMQRAYGVMDWNVEGGPDWIRDDRWDVQASVPLKGDLKERQLQPMLEKLLAERFRLKVHRGSREQSGYALVVVKGGLKAKPSTEVDVDRDSFRLTRTRLEGKGVAMKDFARWVAGKTGVVAVDMTGLPGIYDFKAEWKLEPPPAGAVRSDTEDDDEHRAAVFHALESQLGLKMVPQKIRVETIVIDSVERASAN